MKTYAQKYNGMYINEPPMPLNDVQLKHRFSGLFTPEQIEQLKTGEELTDEDGDHWQLVDLEAQKKYFKQ